MIPSPWEAALLALAAFRLWKLLADDTILDGPRTRFLARWPTYDEWLLCPWCAGAWMAGALWLLWLAADTAALVIATPLALSAGVGLTASAHDRLTHYDS